jgi:hypothetical protein
MPTAKPHVRPRIACGHCEGTGRVPLPDELDVTLRFVAEHQPVTAPDVHRTLMLKEGGPTAANQRLDKLRALGLVKRTGRSGRAWLWEVVR